jgi:hypothetical protein
MSSLMASGSLGLVVFTIFCLSKSLLHWVLFPWDSPSSKECANISTFQLIFGNLGNSDMVPYIRFQGNRLWNFDDSCLAITSIFYLWWREMWLQSWDVWSYNLFVIVIEHLLYICMYARMYVHMYASSVILLIHCRMAALKTNHVVCGLINTGL